MYEVEVKVPASHGHVRDTLTSKGAMHKGTTAQRDVYLNSPLRDFAETDEALRIRSSASIDSEEYERELATIIDEAIAPSDSSRLTYKGPLVDEQSKTRKELETEIGSGADAIELFEHLGFERAAEVRKLRDRYELRGYEVLLDDVVGLGQFVEVEGRGNEGTIEETRDAVLDVVRSLDLNPDDQIFHPRRFRKL
ncbi:MAG: class IV adenylate cyclase [Halobacteriaceae archaeon]